jgi:hypothetical protein
MSDKYGGPAFPSTMHHGATFEGRDISWHDGMTLRDYFAAKAMQAMFTERTTPNHLEMIAKAAYVVANAMLEERAK